MELKTKELLVSTLKITSEEAEICNETRKARCEEYYRVQNDTNALPNALWNLHKTMLSRIYCKPVEDLTLMVKISLKYMTLVESLAKVFPVKSHEGVKY